ncbi:DUF6221 family protein [Phytoactinopolyspora limicola]|uniref:DUF6221 family protein n=1 Tax=Phytoactinopolyspora limicola TaxID=2715536 RepID=UPI00140D58CD|nr:DUF6221 family protein [Phytoactinopolyspora limicola]
MIDEVIAFLRARLDEVEAAASAARTSGQWWVDGPAEQSGLWWVYDTGAKFESEDVARHIARHDPTYVLDNVATMRLIVDEHSPTSRVVGASEPEALGCRTCRTREWPCRTLRILARPWCDHPEFDHTWRL